jgi:hypothetical protein
MYNLAKIEESPSAVDTIVGRVMAPLSFSKS